MEPIGNIYLILFLWNENMVYISNLVEVILDMKIGQDDFWFENMVTENFNMKIKFKLCLIWKYGHGEFWYENMVMENFDMKMWSWRILISK